MQANLEEKRVNDPQLTPTKKVTDDKEEEVNAAFPKKKRGNRKSDVSRQATKVLMKGVDVLKLRNTHNRINTKLTKLQDIVTKKLTHIVTQQKEYTPMNNKEKNYFCVVNEREIF